jgi:hypothetical protein
LTRPEVALIFDDRPVCYDGFIDTGGNILHSVCGSDSLGDRVLHVVALFPHILDGLSQAESLTAEYSGLQKKDQNSGDPNPDRPPVRHLLASLALVVAGCALVFWGAEYVRLDNDRLRLAYFICGLIVEAIGLLLFLLAFIYPNSWGWPL